MKIEVNAVEVPEAMLDVAARSAGFSDGMRVAIGAIRKEVPQASSPETGLALEALADRMEQRWAGGMGYVRRHHSREARLEKER